MSIESIAYKIAQVNMIEGGAMLCDLNEYITRLSYSKMVWAFQNCWCLAEERSFPKSVRLDLPQHAGRVCFIEYPTDPWMTKLGIKDE